MTEQAKPEVVALTLAELGRDRLLAARKLLDDRAALQAARVPAADIRRALALDSPTPTKAMRSVNNWAENGSHGVFIARGGVGAGKTTAAVLWLLEAHGRSSAGWLEAAILSGYSWRAQHDAFERAAKPELLVIDDAGAGESGGDALAGKFEGLLMARIARDQSTLILSNGTTAELEGWLGPRLTSRLRQAGGRVDLDDERDLRRRESKPWQCSSRGCRPCPGDAWHQARALVQIFGVQPDDKLGWRIGDRLVQRVSRSTSAPWAPITAAREALDIDRRLVANEALAMTESRAKVVSEATKTLGVTVDAMTFEAVVEAMARKMGARNDAQRREQLAEANKIIAHAQNRWGGLPREPASPREAGMPARVDGPVLEYSKARAEAAGIWLRHTGDGWEIRRGERRRRRGDDGLPGQLLAVQLPSEEHAWYWASQRILGEEGAA